MSEADERFVIIPTLDGGETVIKWKAIQSLDRVVQGVTSKYRITVAVDGNCGIVEVTEEVYQSFREKLLL